MAILDWLKNLLSPKAKPQSQATDLQMIFSL